MHTAYFTRRQSERHRKIYIAFLISRNDLVSLKAGEALVIHVLVAIVIKLLKLVIAVGQKKKVVKDARLFLQ